MRQRILLTPLGPHASVVRAEQHQGSCQHLAQRKLKKKNERQQNLREVMQTERQKYEACI